jgi:TP901 family phage tail tape measure protein
MNIGTLEATLGVDTAGLAQAQVAMQQFQKKAETSMNTVSQTFDKVGRNMYYFGTASMRFLTLPLALAGAASFKMASDFESSMQKVVGLVGIAQSQVDSWKTALLAMGPELGKSPKELADALYYITSSGIKGAEAMDVLRNSAKASIAGLGETKDVANAVTSAMNAYSTSNLTSGHTLDILTAAVREGKAEGADFARQIGDVIPIASQMGVSFDQVAAGMAAMTLTGISTAESATYLKNMLFAIEKGTPQTRQALKDMGTSIQELRNSITSRGLLPTLENLRTLTNKYGEDMMTKVFPNIRGFMGVLSLMGDRLTANKVLFQKVADSTGDMNKAYLTAADTIKVKFGQALAQVQSSAIQFGLALKGPLINFLEGFANTLKKVTNWFLSLSTAQQQWVLRIGVTIAAIGPLAIGIGLLFRLFAGLTVVIKAIIPMVQAFNMAILRNPIGAILTVLGSYIASLLIFNSLTGTAAEKQQEFNKELERSKELQGETQSIEKRMAALNSMSDLQKQTLKEDILAQRKAQEDFSITLEAELRDRLKHDKDLLDLQKQYQESTNNGVKAFIVNQIQRKKEAIAKDLEAQYNGNQQSIQLLNGFLTTVDSKLKSTKKVRTNVIDPEEMTRVSKFVLAQLKIQDDVIKHVGQDYDLFISKISKGGKTQTALTIKIPKLELDTTPIDNYRKHFMFMETDLATPMGTLQKKLADIALQNAILGDSFDPLGVKVQTVGDQINLVKQRLQVMLDQGIRPGNTAMEYMGLTIDQYTKKLRELEIAQRRTTLAINMGKLASDLYNDSLSGNITSVNDFANALRSAVIKMIAMYIAEAVAVQVTSAMKSSKNPWLGLVLGAAAGAATIALFESIVPKFAKGGVIPQGYPNDTYPAMLSSGEKVIPANVDVSNKNNDWAGEVIFRIDGYELVGILNKQNKKTNIL